MGNILFSPSHHHKNQQQHALTTESTSDCKGSNCPIPAVLKSRDSMLRELSTPPTKMEVLGEHLYAKIQELQEAGDGELDVAKLTGVLLELGEQKVLMLLQDSHLLQESVEQVKQHVPDVCCTHQQQSVCTEVSSLTDEDWSTDSDLEEYLYDQVCQQEPELSQHITGMLLEMDRAQLRRLLKSPAQLTQAIHRARVAYSQHLSQEHHSLAVATPSLKSMADQTCQQCKHIEKCVTSDRQEDVSTMDTKCQQLRNSANGGQSDWEELVHQGQSTVEEIGGRCRSMVPEGDQKYRDGVEEWTEEDLGDVVYAEAERLHPKAAAKLTGMILDMGADQVKQLLQDSDQLRSMINMAFSSLSPSIR